MLWRSKPWNAKVMADQNKKKGVEAIAWLWLLMMWASKKVLITHRVYQCIILRKMKQFTRPAELDQKLWHLITISWLSSSKPIEKRSRYSSDLNISGMKKWLTIVMTSMKNCFMQMWYFLYFYYTINTYCDIFITNVIFSTLSWPKLIHHLPSLSRPFLYQICLFFNGKKFVFPVIFAVFSLKSLFETW